MYGKRLKQLLANKKIKQNELAKMINIPPSTINSWMDKYYIRLENIEKVCKALNIDIWEFFLTDMSKIYKISDEYIILAKQIDHLGEKKDQVLKVINEIITLLK